MVFYNSNKNHIFQSKLLKTKRIIFQGLLVYLIYVFSLLISLTIPSYSQNETNHQQILLVRSDHNYPPYEFMENGKPTGFNIELIQAIADTMGLKISITPGQWDEVRDDLEHGRIDLLAMYYSDERNKYLSFSLPYTMVSPAIFVRKDSKITSFKDIKDKTIVAQEGDIMHDYLKEQGIKNIITAKNSPDVLRIIASGQYDGAVLSSELQGLYFTNKLNLNNLKVINTDIPPRSYCFAVKKGNEELLYKLDEGLKILKANGKYREIYQKWFGVYEKSYQTKHVKYYLIALFIVLIILAISILWLWILKIEVRKRTEESRKSEERLNYAIEGSNDGIWDWNIVTGETYTNSRYYTMLGFKTGELPADLKTLGKILHPDDKERITKALENYIKGDNYNYEEEYRLKAKNGDWKWILIRGGIVQKDKDGRPVRMTGTSSDITERKKMEEALKESNRQLEDALKRLKTTQEQLIQHERFRALGQIASGVAHDINNALTPILGHCEIISMNGKLDENDKKSINSIKTLSKDIASTVSRMREFYKPQTEEKLIFPLKLNKIITEVLELTRPRWKDMSQKNGIMIEIKTELSEDLPYIYGIESEIREALTNIIFNSLDAMPEGGEIKIKTSITENTVNLEFTDTGTGMDENTKKHCLEPFFTTKGERGTGLGLSMVYGIIKRHDGDIIIDSKEGTGSTVKISFSRPVKEQISNNASKQDDVPKPVKILCIDDEGMVLQILRLLLEKDMHTVETAEGGHKGIELFSEHKAKNSPFSIVITDLGMPRIDGNEVAKKIKELSPDTPVIIMTGWGSMLEQSSTIPADGLIAKPFTINDIRQAIQKCNPCVN